MPKSRLITARQSKTAIDWTGPLDKHNRREDRGAADQLARELASTIPQMLKSIKVKGDNLYEYVHQHGGLKGLLGQTDPDLKKAYYQFRGQLEQLLKDTDETSLNRFYNEYGRNPLDWGFVKTSRGPIMARKAKKAAFTDKGIDVPVGQMRNEFESDFSGDARSTETDHKDDKFNEKNLSKGARMAQARRKYADAFQDTLGEKIVPVVAEEDEAIPVSDEGAIEETPVVPEETVPAKPVLADLIKKAIEDIIVGMGGDLEELNYETILEKILENPSEFDIDENVDEEEFNEAWEEAAGESPVVEEEGKTSAETPQVGDPCKADPEEEGVFLEGTITKIENGVACSDLYPGFCGDIPTSKQEGVWVFDSF